MPKPPLCMNSGKPTKYGNTFASVDDYKAYQARVEGEVAELAGHGFAQDAMVPNLFTKNGVAITLESYRRDKDGILAAHAGLVDQQARSATGE